MKKILSVVAVAFFAGSLLAQVPPVKTGKVKAPVKKEGVKAPVKKGVAQSAKPAAKKAEKR